MKSIFSSVYGFLEDPRVYMAIQSILGIGRGYTAESIQRLIRPAEDQKVLDLGCGPGRCGALFQCSYFGADLNFRYVRYARSRDFKKNPARHYVQSRAGSPGFKKESFDYTMCVGLLHHMSNGEVENSLNWMKTMLKPGGKAFVFEAVYPRERWNFIGRLILKMDRGSHVRTKAQLDQILYAHAFKEATYQIPLYRSFPYHQFNYVYEKVGR